jgi:hypothetical protein
MKKLLLLSLFTLTNLMGWDLVEKEPLKHETKIFSPNKSSSASIYSSTIPVEEL